MFNKLYEKTKPLIKKITPFLIILITFFILTMNLPYYISAPGGLINTKEKINESIKTKGSLNMTYVSEMHANIPTLFWALIDKNWDIEKEKDTVTGHESIEDLQYRNKMLLKEANCNALKVAYENSNVKYEITNTKIYITYIDDLSKTNLKVGDQIIKVDGKKINSKESLYKLIQNKKIGQKVYFNVLKDGKEETKYATLIDVNGKPKVGALVTNTFDLKSNKKITFNFKDSESGPSGGLMLALTIYSSLNNVDLTHGKTIAGTGTIEENGDVGPISGVKYKLIGAYDKGAQIFLVPDGENYKEAKKVKEEKGYDIDIVPVKNFKEALKYLENLS